MDVVSPILEKAGAGYVINKLINVAATYVRDQYYWKTDLQEELQDLRRLLPQIQAVVGFAEYKLTSHEASQPALIQWLWQFRNEIDEAEEVLDELEYHELEKKANSDKSRLSRTVNASVKAAKRLLKFDDVLRRLRTCVKNLNTSASDVEKFLALVTQTGSIGTGQMQQVILPLTSQSRITSALPESSFKGREEEKGKIIQYLLGESVEESEIQMSENVHCLPLVAMGGMGKTALAQQVFDHFESVKKEHFDIKIWVCVSTDFNALNLMKKILEYPTGRSESGPLERLPVKLKKELDSKRFLLVLDDAWDDKNQREWEKLCSPLRYGKKGSWILLTTRLRSVAKMVSKVIRGTMEPMMLLGLSNDECRSLLYEHAFAGQDPNSFPPLKELGEEIVEKLKGVPLLAKSIGGALNTELKHEHWASISRSEIWKTPQDSTYEFIPALTLSYVMLRPRLKRCFSFCSIFPQDYKFDKQKLVCMWVAAGLIYPDESEEGSDEDIANCCFDILCNKSFFDVHTNYWSSYFYGTAKDFYTMHDMLNGLARHVSRYECCRIVHDAPRCILDYNAIRHIFISISITSTDAQLHDLAKMVCKLTHLRTFWIEYDGHPQKLHDFIRDACKSPRRIRVLIMESSYSGLSCQPLESICEFVKLRFLDIAAHRQSLSVSVSESICKFYFLQVLIGDRDYPILKKDANKLTNLRHLYGVEEDALLSVPEVGKLTSLQKLCFSVGTKPGHRIDELMNMVNLRKLKIKRLFNVRSLEETKKVNLVSKTNLTRLELHYRDEKHYWNTVSNPDLDEHEVLAALRPPPTIRELFIRDYKGGRLAPWMDTSSLSWLESLELYACTSLEELPPLWKLPHLKFLKLERMEAIRSLGCHTSDQMDIQFPVLEELVFNNLPLLEEWNGADDRIWFPHLRSFEIHQCPRLKKTPDLPSSIENLSMKYWSLEGLAWIYCADTSEDEDFKFGKFRRFQFRGFQQLMSLESLQICYRPMISTADVRRVADDSEIVQIGSSIGEEDDNLLPSSVKKLELGLLHKHEDLASCLRGLTSLTRLTLYCSLHMESLPSANELEHLTALQYLSILHSEGLTSPGGLYIIKSLKSLTIRNCPKFLSAEDESQEFLEAKTRKHAASSSSVFDHSASHKAARMLPSSLESLTISDISQESLGRCLQGLTSLQKLKVIVCSNLVSLPNTEYLNNLTALRKLSIICCYELHELESLTALVSLRKLKIYYCPKLLATTFSTPQNPATTTEQSATKIKKGTLPSLEEIDIDSIFYLPILPISERLKILSIRRTTENPLVPCFPSEIEEWLLQCRESLEVLELGEMPHLQSLPISLGSFSSLKVLSINFAPELESLPKMPALLETLTIYGCSAMLQKRCQKNIGPDWPNIEHIDCIYITTASDKEDKAESE